MSYSNDDRPNWGAICALAFLILLGLPFAFLNVLGDRDCDVLGRPCSPSTGTLKLLTFLAVLTTAAVIKWFVDLVTRE